MCGSDKPSPTFYILTKAVICPETARQKILSILQHVTNRHGFPSFTLFSKCAHGPLDQDRPWIAAGEDIRTKKEY